MKSVSDWNKVWMRQFSSWFSSKVISIWNESVQKWFSSWFSQEYSWESESDRPIWLVLGFERIQRISKTSKWFRYHIGNDWGSIISMTIIFRPTLFRTSFIRKIPEEDNGTAPFLMRNYFSWSVNPDSLD